MRCLGVKWWGQKVAEAWEGHRLRLELPKGQVGWVREVEAGPGAAGEGTGTCRGTVPLLG